MTSLLYKIGLAAMMVMVAFTGGYFTGRQHGREALLKSAVQSYQLRETINHETNSLSSVALCLALGGVQSECAALMRGFHETASSQ